MPVGFDQVIVCNMALAHVGSKTTIESIDEQNPAAKQCKLWYEPARFKTLEAFDWSFARKSELLSAHSVAAPTNRWAFRYQWPADCVAPRLIENPAGPNEDAVPYEVEGAGDDTQSIVTDMEQAVLIYTRNTSAIQNFSMHAIEGFALALAMRISYKLNGKTSLLQKVTNAFDKHIDKAYIVDIAGSITREVRDAQWIKDRT